VRSMNALRLALAFLVLWLVLYVLLSAAFER
jgi:hypothetical protein